MLLQQLRTEATTDYFVIKSFLLALLFVSITTTLVNIQNFWEFSTASYAVGVKLKILGLLFIGSFQTISTLDLILVGTVGILFGMNTMLIVRKIKFIKERGSIKLTAGAGFLSIATAGCASCGLSVISLFGLGGAIAILPFGGVELYLVAIGALLFSLRYNLKAIYKACALPAKS